MNQPIKSTNDKKEYRLITLKNRLKCLLVSDLTQTDDSESESTYNDETASNSSQCGTDSADISEQDYDEDEDEDDEMDEDEDDDEDEDEEGGGDPRHGGKDKSKAKMSAACMVVNVGSYSDPKDIPGLAHFIEHMVFMGSEKYPIENDFDSFLGKHGGDSNAHTMKEKTYFHFDVESLHFFTALDIFANFFISPLMRKDSMDREIESVDSEFKIDAMNDDLRREQIIASLAYDNHPVSNFVWGNALTLKTKVKDQDIDLYARAKEFREKYYTAQDMQLVVLSKESLDTLEKQVRQIFGKIQDNELTNELPVPSGEIPFEAIDFNKFYKVKSIKEMDDLYLLWSLPSDKDYYKEKPLGYISSLIGYEGEGSLFSALKSRHWATYLEGGSSGLAEDADSYWTEFTIHIELTVLGHDHIDEVITMVFQYIKMLQKQPPCKHYYDELAHIAKSTFSYKEMSDVMEYVDTLASGIRFYKDRDIITGDYLYEKFDKELIINYQDLLQCNNVNLMLFSKRHSKCCNLVEPWFKTDYFVEDIPSSLRDRLQNISLSDEFFLPHENPLIATEFKLKEVIKEYKTPVPIIDNSQGIFFYCNNKMFEVPKGGVYILFENNLIRSSDKNSCLSDIYLNTLNHNLNEVAYLATNAQLDYNITMSMHGFLIDISGFDHKISKLLQIILKFVIEFDFTDELWDSMMIKIKKDYTNEFLHPEQVARTTRLSVLEKHHHGFHLRMKQLDSLVKQDLRDFAKSLISEVYIRCLIQGNFGKREATEIYTNCLSTLGCKALKKEKLVQPMCLQVPVGSRILESNSCGQDNNCMIVNYYQLWPGKLKSYAINELLMVFLKEPLFDELRTRKQLGYSVYNSAHYSYGVVGFSISVHSQSDQFSMQKLDEHIEIFLQNMLTKIKEMSDLQFSILKNGLIKLLSCEDTHMFEQINRNWNVIYGMSRNFNFLKKQIEFLKNFQQRDLQLRLESYLDPEIRRKLSIRVVQKSTPKIHGDKDLVEIIPEGSSDIQAPVTLEQFKQTNTYHEFSKIY